MRLTWGIIVALCLSRPASGLRFLQQETPPAAARTTQDAPGNPPAPEVEKDASSAPKTEPKKKVDAGPASANGKRRAAGRRVSAPAPEGAPRKIVVREGGANEPTAQIVTGMPPEEATRQRQRAEELLTSTGESLKRIAPRTLDARQQETVSQIHHYMEGARSALKEGDIARAHTLAVKANLLADDLDKHP
jgi:hypothetical protein